MSDWNPDDGHEAWVDFNDIERDGTTMTLRRFAHPDLDANNVGLWILVGDGEGNTAQAEVLSVDDPIIRLRVNLDTFESGPMNDEDGPAPSRS